jgi:MFS family permease
LLEQGVAPPHDSGMHPNVAANPALQRRLQANLWLFAGFRWLVMFMLLGPIWVVYLQEDRGLSLTQVTAMEGPFWFALVLFEVPTGVIADRFGRKTSLLCGAMVNFVAILIFAMADNFALLFGSYMLWAAGLTMLSGADSAFYYDTLKALGRENEYQKRWGRMWALSSAAAGTAILIGGPLGSWLGLQAPIIATAICSFIAMLIAFTFLEPPVEEEEHGATKLGMVGNTRVALRLVRANKPVLLIMGFGGVLAGIVMTSDVLVQPYLRGHDIDVGWFGPLLLPGRILGIIAALMAYRITASFGLRGTLALIIALAGVPLAGLASWDSMAAFAVYPLFGAISGVMQPMISDYINRRIPSSQRATVLSFLQLFFSLVAAMLVPAGGFLGEAFNLRVAYAGIGIFLACVAIPIAIAFLRADRKAGPLPEPGAAASPLPAEEAMGAQPAGG